MVRNDNDLLAEDKMKNSKISQEGIQKPREKFVFTISFEFFDIQKPVLCDCLSRLGIKHCSANEKPLMPITEVLICQEVRL